METVLQAKNMTKIYGMGSKQPFTALENIDLEIKTGEFIVVMGPSGSGKSTGAANPSCRTMLNLSNTKLCVFVSLRVVGIAPVNLLAAPETE